LASRSPPGRAQDSMPILAVLPRPRAVAAGAAARARRSGVSGGGPQGFRARAQVEDNMDFIAALPHLRVVMMGKQWGSWAPRSMHFLTEFAARLALRHGSADVLRVSFPGHAPAGGERELLS